MKLRHAFIALFALAGAVLSAQNSFAITYPEPEDTFQVREELSELLVEFTGTVSKTGKEIVVHWTRGDGQAKDDWKLKQYKPGETSFIYRASSDLSNLAYGTNKYEFVVTFADGTVKRKTMNIYVIHTSYAERAKPVIYLYPTEEETVAVSVKPQGGLTRSIPEMGSGWRVKASPDGRITDLGSEKAYPYLFWESADDGRAVDTSAGFVVEKGKLDSFLKEKLSLLGLRGREISDFEEFWLPILSAKPYAFLTFHDKARIDREAPLEVTPRPDSVIRVYFEYLLLDAPITTKPQELAPAQRSGFSVVEWGGRRVR